MPGTDTAGGVRSTQKNTTPVACPKCGNTSHDKGLKGGITHCTLEWRITPVIGVREGEVILDYDNSDIVDVENGVATTMTNTPNATTDLEHLFCHRCEWNWYDPRPTNG